MNENEKNLSGYGFSFKDYIKILENPNKIGLNNGVWSAPILKGYDKNQRGYGIDINTNKKAKALTNNRPGKWLTEKEADTLMDDHINYITEAANKHIKGFSELPFRRRWALLGMLYRGDSVNKSGININEPDDLKFFKSISDYYRSKGLNTRANNSDEFFNSPVSKLLSMFKLKQGGQIRKMLTAAGGSIHYSRTMDTDNLSKAANYVGKYVLKGLGAFGKFLNAGFTSPTYGTIGQVSYARNAKDAKRLRKQSEASEQAMGKAMTWVSPLNYGAAVWNGHGLNARKGEEEVASWSPAWQAVGRLGELYVGPKAVKGVKSAPRAVINTAAKAGVKPAKAAVVAREINLATKNKPNIEIPKAETRTKVGDVEIDNPNLLYHLDRGDGAGAFSNQGAYVENGFLFPGVAKKEGLLGYSWWNKGKPYATSIKGQPMTRLITTTKDAPGMLLVRSQNYPIGQWTGSKGFVLPSEYVNSEGVNVSGSIYNWKPGYGYKKITQEPSTSLAFFGKKPSKSVTREYVQSPKDITSDVGDLIAEGSERSVYSSKSNPNIVYKIEDGNAPLEDINNIKIRSEINDDIIAPETTVGYYKHKNGKYYRVTQQDKYKSYDPDNFYEEVSPELNLEIIKTLEKAGWKVNIEDGHATTASKNGVTIGNLEHFNWGRDSKGNLKLIDLYIVEKNPSENNIVGMSYDYRMEDPKGSMDFLKQFFALLKINGKEYTLEGLRDAANVQQGLPEHIQSYLNLNTVERAVRAMRKNGYSEREIQLYIDKVNEEMNKVKVGMYSDLEYNAAGALGFGGFYNNDLNFISVNKDAYLSKPNFTSNYILKHEGRHLIDYNTSMTDDVINILEKAYDKDFLEIPKHEDAGNLKDYLHMDRERVTTNRDARDVLLSNLEKNPGEFLNLIKFAQTSFGKNKDMVDFLNELILYAEPEEIINAVENSNGYGKRYINYLKKNNKLTPAKIEQLRLAMIHVPSYLLPIAGGYTLYNLFNQPLQQLQYLKQGGKMNILEFLKNGSGIHIKEKNKGKFTSYCGGKVTDECIRKAKASGNPTLVKRATFADNARHFKHKEGGKAFVNGVNVLDSNPKAYKYVKKKYKMAQQGTKLNFFLKAGNWLSNNGDLVKSIANAGLGIVSNILLNKAIDSQIEANKKQMEVNKQKAFMENYKKALGLQTDKSDIINMSRAWLMANNLDYSGNEELMKENALLENSRNGGLLDSLGGLASSILNSSNLFKKSNTGIYNLNSDVGNTTYNWKTNTFTNKNKVGTINSNGSMNTGIGGTTYNWNTNTFGSNNIMNSFDKIKF